MLDGTKFKGLKELECEQDRQSTKEEVKWGKDFL